MITRYNKTTYVDEDGVCYSAQEIKEYWHELVKIHKNEVIYGNTKWISETKEVRIKGRKPKQQNLWE